MTEAAKGYLKLSECLFQNTQAEPSEIDRRNSPRTRPLNPLMKSVRIFSNTYCQLENLPNWRSGWDSNPRPVYSTSTRFPIALLRPLGHHSANFNCDYKGQSQQTSTIKFNFVLPTSAVCATSPRNPYCLPSAAV